MTKHTDMYGRHTGLVRLFEPELEFDNHVVTMDEAVDGIVRSADTIEAEFPAAVLAYTLRSAVELQDDAYIQGQAFTLHAERLGLDADVIRQGLKKRAGVLPIRRTYKNSSVNLEKLEQKY